MIVRKRLRRADGRIFLERWGVQLNRIGGVFLHRMDAPDPGIDLHDHPWWFVSLVIKGGYFEERAPTRLASRWAEMAQERPYIESNGILRTRQRWSIKSMRLDECHRIVSLNDAHSWSIIIHGPVRRAWGFYLPSRFMEVDEYDRTVRAARRDMTVERTRGRSWTKRI